MDITATNAVDLSAITGGSGDCQGNTNITFTTAASQISAATDNWSTLATWQDGVGTDRVPLPQDDVSCSHTVTVDMPRIGKSITFTGTPTVTLSVSISIYGSLTLASGMTYTGKHAEIFMGRGNYNLTSAGKTLYSVFISAPNGTLSFQDDIVLNNLLRQYIGSLVTNSHMVTAGLFYTGELGPLVRTINLGSSTIIFNATTAVKKWLINNAVNLTLDTGTSTIILTNSGTNAQTFAGGGLTYNNVVVKGAGDYNLTVTGNNTFNTLTIDATEAIKTITGTAGSTQTIRELVVINPLARAVTINSSGAAWTLTGQRGKFEAKYLALTNVSTDRRYTYYAPGGTDNGGNTYWLFEKKPKNYTKINGRWRSD
jgi:hypothetical protein